jgi:hypothetical protein
MHILNVKSKHLPSDTDLAVQNNRVCLEVFMTYWPCTNITHTSVLMVNMIYFGCWLGP